MTEEDAADVVASYGRAAADAKRLGFDALEVHAAHGYLVDQFFWAETNPRGDRFGGAGLRERAQFGAEIFREMRRAVGEDFVIMMRISRSEEQTSELQSLMRNSYAVFCLQKKQTIQKIFT